MILFKPSIRPLFIFTIAAATLCLHLIISDNGSSPKDPHSLQTVFNQTLMKFCELDLGENGLKQNVEHLVDSDNFRNPRLNLRSFRSIGRYGFDPGSRSGRVGGMGVSIEEFRKLRVTFRRNLQDWWRRRRFDFEVMSKSTLVNGGELAVAVAGRKYETCAVVGNSGILLKDDNLGRVIDGHEFVIRLNNARVGGFERFVGGKTSLAFVNSNILHLCTRRGGCFCHPYGEKVPILMYIAQPVHFLDYTVCNSSHKAKLMITDPQFDVLCARIVKYYSVKRFMMETGKPMEAWSSSRGGPEFHYSSGMQAIMLALGVCDKVSIFGFGKSDSAKHHYHTNQKTELSLHDYQAEYDLYEDLVKNPEAVPFVSDKFKFPNVIIHR